ncbi:MAG: MAPEG family protein [Pseudomonadota bacterium]
MLIPTTSIALAAFFAIFSVVLSVQTSLQRVKLSVGHGDGGDDTLRRRIRAHGNFTEYAPLSVILLGFMEMLGAAHQVVLGIGLAMALARLVHAVGMLYTSKPFLQGAGMLLQHAAFLFCAVRLLIFVCNAA